MRLTCRVGYRHFWDEGQITRRSLTGGSKWRRRNRFDRVELFLEISLVINGEAETRCCNSIIRPPVLEEVDE